MKKNLFISILILMPLFVLSQSLVTYKKADGVDYSAYKTYKINKLNVESYPEFEPKREGINLLMLEIQKQLNGRGYSQAVDNPDLIINIGVTLQPKVRTRETGLNDAPKYIGQRNYHWESEEVVTERYTEGTVALDIVDSSKNEMIWQAISKGAISEKREKNKKKISKAVAKLFKKFPVGIKN